MIDFDAAYAEHHGPLLAATVRKVGDLQTAADIVATVWSRAWERRSTFDPARGSVGAWLNCIRRSAIANHYRAKRETLPLVAEPAAAPDDDRPDLARALERLPEPLSEAIRLIYLAEKTFPEAAKALGLSVGCVHKRTLLGIQRLRRILAA